MIITVKQELLDLIKRVEESELEDYKAEYGETDIPLTFGWTYGASGDYAEGESVASRPYARYQVCVLNSGSVDVYRDELNKWSNDGWTQHELSTDYEGDDEDE